MEQYEIKNFCLCKKATTVILGNSTGYLVFQYFPNKGDAENSYLGQAAKSCAACFQANWLW